MCSGLSEALLNWRGLDDGLRGRVRGRTGGKGGVGGDGRGDRIRRMSPQSLGLLSRARNYELKFVHPLLCVEVS
jgi:hypothetical protein